MVAAGEAFDPMLIVYQMVALQCFYYLAAGVLFGACHVLFGTRVSLDLFFSARHLTTASAAGWLEIVIVSSEPSQGAVARRRRATERGAGRAPIPLPCPIIRSQVFACARSAVLLSLIIEKCKKCLDFTVTLFFVHLLVCTIYEARAPRVCRNWGRSRLTRSFLAAL